MEHGASERVKEQSHTLMPVKTEVDKAAQSTAYRGVQTNVNYTEGEAGLVELVKSEPVLLVKEEVVEDRWQDIAENQCVRGPTTSAIIGSTNVFDGIADLNNIIDIKEELGAIDTGPTVLQHMDTQGTTNQIHMSIVKQEGTTNQNKIDPILCGGVEEEIIEDERRGSEPRIYICDYCKNMFPNKKGVRQHIARVHGSGSYKCDQCDKIFKCKDYLVTHTSNMHKVKVHTAVTLPLIYTCDYCHKTYTTKYNLIYHIDVVHKKVLYSCFECNKEYKGKHLLQRHMKKVHPKEEHEVTSPVVHTCNYCHKTYARMNNLFYHIDVVHTKVGHRCSECNKEFKGKHCLQRHMKKVHSQEEHKVSSPVVHTCDYCHKTYKTKNNLMYHIEAVHTKVRYRCPECNKEYTSKLYLQRHIRMVHSKEKDEYLRTPIITCDYCLKTFCTKSGLRQHVKKIHVAAHTHCCLRCDMNFESSDKLQQHNASIHGKSQRKCEVCLRVFAARSSLRRHCKNAHNSKDVHFKSDLRRHEMLDSPPTADDMNAAASTSAQQHNVVVVKEEQADGEVELGPVVFQHMDCNYRPYKEEP